MLTRFIKIQLIIFTILTVIALLVLGIYYLRLPSVAGIGQYKLYADLPRSGGLYSTANVTYRGITIGKVTDVEPTEHGAQATIDRFAYLPFGAGPRKCIGSTFALQEATLVLAVIVKHFRFQLKAGHAVWPTLRVTLRPANGLPMILSKRSSNEQS